MTAERSIVLIVEDEPLLRLAAVEMVQRAGYGTIEASNADDALAILETHNDIRAIFTDVQMPGSIDGQRLAMAVRDRWPPIEIIVTSGRELLASDRLPSRARFLAKPYEDSKLAGVLHELVPLG